MIDKIIGVFMMIVVVAMLTVVLRPGSQAALIVTGLFAGFANSLRAAQGR